MAARYVPPARRKELERESRSEVVTAAQGVGRVDTATGTAPMGAVLEKREEEELEEQEQSRNNALHRYFLEKSEIYRKFVEFSDAVRQDKTIDHVFEAERPQGATIKGPSALDLDAEFQLQKFEQFTKLISEVDRFIRFTDVLRAGRNKRFLDVCCAPGGFSRYIVQRMADDCTGVGLALPVSKGGFAVLFRSPRFTALDADVLNVQEPGQGQRWGHELLRYYASSHFDLVLCDGQFMQKNEGITRVRGWRLLLLAQFAVAFDNLSPGGTLLFRARHTSSRLHASCLYLFSTCFSDIRFAKPQFATHKSFVYISCTNFDASRRSEVLAILSEKIGALRSSAEMVEVLRGEDEEELAQTMAPGLLREFEPMWGMQLQALARWYRRIKAKIDPRAHVAVPELPEVGDRQQKRAGGQESQDAEVEEGSKGGPQDWRADSRYSAASSGARPAPSGPSRPCPVPPARPTPSSAADEARGESGASDRDSRNERPAPSGQAERSETGRKDESRAFRGGDGSSQPAFGTGGRPSSSRGSSWAQARW
eukprot:tig00001229_g7838.t1